ncbi:hypothetical protein JYK00_00645 [Thermosipho ferrireducens]|uniref:Lipoprotein n=1 Tax=Thermosipho ferrireducens TaxID=2571116 RepID=A0ABX7S8G3_9BACT|nr:hypothetical protein [Thermosipho ferrireducens]QTA38090.1 hypothetical protein JYK00_00645 [Thermosipho ferrireducens]
MKGRKTIIFFVSIVFIIWLLISCSTPQFEKEEDGENSVENETIFDGKIIVKMDLSNVVTLQRTELNGKYYFVYVNLSGDRMIRHKTIDSTDFEFTLEKGHIYIMGIFEKTSEGILPIGIIADKSGNLTSFPITKSATSVINLGTLVASGEILSSVIPLEDFAKLLGNINVEELKQFAGYDVTLKNFLNPDVNRNSVFDDEEGIYWMERTSYDFNIDDLDYYENPNNPFDKQVASVVLFWINYKNHELKTDLYTTSPCATLVLPNGKKINSTNSGKIDDYSYYFYFNPSYLGEEVSFFESGEYKITLKDLTEKRDITLKFNWFFFNYADNLKGMIFPVTKLVAYSDGVAKSFYGKWYRVKDKESVEQVDLDLVNMIRKKDSYIPIYTWEDIRAGEVYLIKSLKNYSEDNKTIHVDFDGKMRVLRTYFFKLFRSDFVDIGNNDFPFRMRIKYLTFPFEYGNNLDWSVPINDANIVGIWYNHSFMDDSQKPAVLVFQPDGELYVFNSWEWILWSRLSPNEINEWSLENGNLTVKRQDGTSVNFQVDLTRTDDERIFLRLKQEDSVLVYTNFYSYIKSYGKILDEKGVDYPKLSEVKILEAESGILKWKIQFHKPYDRGIVSFDIYTGKSPDKMRLTYFAYEDYASMKNQIFEKSFDELGIKETDKYVKIIANQWSRIVESNILEIK